MATPAQIQPPNPTNSIKSAARKLPIKRKTPVQSQSPTPIPISIDTTPIPISNPDPSLHSSIILSNNTASYDDGFEEDDEEDDFDDDESQDQEASEITIPAPGTNGVGGGGGHLKPPPFKFHRIWSEPDEIRFLQGLLGCWSQGLVFPRDLNVFYDRFSESMPQPYTRSQLSEKLRRLRKKFRVMSARIARGQHPNRLAPHDRDLLHLCTRLWDSQYASTSPFLAASDAVAAASSAAAPAAGTAGNKRRRPNPRRPKVEDVAPPPPPPPPPPHRALPAPPAYVSEKENEAAAVTEEKAVPMAMPSGVDSTGKDGEVGGCVAAKTVLDVFDGSLEETRMSLKGSDGSDGNELTRRWREQRIAELDVFARRLRLLLEQSLNN